MWVTNESSSPITLRYTAKTQMSAHQDPF